MSIVKEKYVDNLRNRRNWLRKEIDKLVYKEDDDGIQYLDCETMYELAEANDKSLRHLSAWEIEKNGRGRLKMVLTTILTGVVRNNGHFLKLTSSGKTRKVNAPAEFVEQVQKKAAA